ncbi:MAG: twin-arginine translocase subunit TatC [Faecalibacterium prausnitzii]
MDLTTLRVHCAPQEKLMQYFRVSLLAAVVVTMPVALYQVYAFAKPGLKRSETLLLQAGACCWVWPCSAWACCSPTSVMMPFMLRFLSYRHRGCRLHHRPSTSIESYVNLCLTMFIIFGCVFEMPLVTIILSKMGIANPEILKKGRGVAIVLIFFIAAVVTPPDIVSQCIGGCAPWCLLYFISISPERHLL